MKSFLIGTVLDPEVRHIKTKAGDKRDYIVFGILSGRSSIEFQVWDNDRAFDKVKQLGEGQIACVIVNDRVDEKGKIVYYIDDCAECPVEFQLELQSFFKEATAKH